MANTRSKSKHGVSIGKYRGIKMAFNSLIDKRDRAKRQERTYLKAETNDTHDDLGDDLESVVRFDVVFEDVRQSYRVADIVLKSFHAVNAEDKPQFQ